MDPSVIAIVASLVGAVAVLCVVYLVVRGQGRSGARAVEDLLAATDRLNEGQIALGGRLAPTRLATMAMTLGSMNLS
ncbi:MAG: hypothetical protein QNJ92_13685 [Alphaproteobacteria bacterium]|nr:hypothetical protein [Alphaproteobacteria bacterium]